MTESEKIKLLAKMYNDILYFALVVLPHHFSLQPADFHKEVAKLLSEENRYTCIVAPRGSAKSTLVSLAFALHQALFKKARFIVLLSDTATQSERFLDTIKGELEGNDTIKLLFGDMVGKRKWTTTEIELPIGVKIAAMGSGGKIRGIKWNQHRPDLEIIDDLENDELVKNKERRKELFDWYTGAVLPSLAKNGRIVVIGTILHYDSLLNRLSKDELYARKFYKIIKPDGSPLWEANMNKEDIENLKEHYRSQGQIDTFYCEYMNTPISDENAVFHKDWFKYWSEKDIDTRFLTRVLAVDPAISQKDGADYSAIMVCGMDSEHKSYVLEYTQERYTPLQIIEEIFRLGSKWDILNVGIESVAYQKSLVYYFKEEMKRKNKFFMVDELKPDADKERRIKALQPRYAVGHVFHRPSMTALEEELLMFPKSPHDDLSDVLAYCHMMLTPGQATSRPYNPDLGRGVNYQRKDTLANF